MWRPGRRRGQRGWERELLREIRGLETTDVRRDEPLAPLPRRLPRRRRRTRRRAHRPSGHRPRLSGERRRTLLTVAITVALVVGLGAVSFGPAAPVVRRLVGLGPSGGGNGHDYAFIRRDRSGLPVGFAPCHDIHFQVNPAQAPPGWQQLVSTSIATVSQATGLTFVDDGTTSDDDYFDRRNALTGAADPVLIGWTTSDRVEDLDGDVAGVTSSDYDSRSGHYDTGRVVLDADAYRTLDDEPGGARGEQAILLHELGHLVGLAHVDDPGELMYPTVTYRDSYGPGDLAGLRVLGELHC